jgi:hypothetical protein
MKTVKTRKRKARAAKPVEMPVVKAEIVEEPAPQKVIKYVGPDLRDYFKADAGRTVELAPDEITIIRELAGRFDRGAKDIREYADSLKTEGQLESCGIFLAPEGQPVLATGFGRYDAIVTLRSQRTKNPVTGLPWKVRCHLMPATEAMRAFVQGVHSNIKRKALTPADMLVVIRTMLAPPYNLKPADIARELKISPATVSLHRRLEKFSDWAIRQVHEGKIAARSAFDLAKDLESMEEIDKTIKGLLEESGGKKVSSSKVRRKISEKTGKGKARSASEIVKTLKTAAADEERDDLERDLFGIFADYSRGKFAEKGLYSKIEDWIKAFRRKARAA